MIKLIIKLVVAIAAILWGVSWFGDKKSDGEDLGSVIKQQIENKINGGDTESDHDDYDEEAGEDGSNVLTYNTTFKNLSVVGIPKGMTSQRVDHKAYVTYFNKKYRIPNCVIYELTAANARSEKVNRNDYKFNADPKANGSPEWWEYKNSGYDRGHMAPANDFKWDATAMKECFYMSNMCPQVHTLNNDAWNKLELKVHSWAERDGRCIVATGPVLTDDMPRIGNKSDIAVPRSFYKVVYEPAQQRAIAFVYANEEARSGLARHVVTVDEVERLTGLDFFANLPVDVQASLESNSNLNDWK